MRGGWPGGVICCRRGKEGTREKGKEEVGRAEEARRGQEARSGRSAGRGWERGGRVAGLLYPGPPAAGPSPSFPSPRLPLTNLMLQDSFQYYWEGLALSYPLWLLTSATCPPAVSRALPSHGLVLAGGRGSEETRIASYQRRSGGQDDSENATGSLYGCLSRWSLGQHFEFPFGVVILWSVELGHAKQEAGAVALSVSSCLVTPCSTGKVQSLLFKGMMAAGRQKPQKLPLRVTQDGI